jgi:hypothetical protein
MTKRLVSAFPNAYVDVDEPPNNSVLVKALALVGMIGIAYIGLTTLILDFAPTGYDPVRQVVSDMLWAGLHWRWSLASSLAGWAWSRWQRQSSSRTTAVSSRQGLRCCS